LRKLTDRGGNVSAADTKGGHSEMFEQGNLKKEKVLGGGPLFQPHQKKTKAEKMA